MALSGWFVGLVALGVLPIIVTGDPGVLGLWLLGVIVLGAIDLIAAGSPRGIVLGRDLPGRVRLGETVASTLLLTNTGRRRVHGIVRDGWQPSAAARPRTAHIDLPPGERRSVITMLTPPSRRAA